MSAHRQPGDADDRVVAGRHHLWHFRGRFGECHGELDGERVAGDRERHAQLQSGGDDRAVGGDDDAVSHVHAFGHDGLHDGDDLGLSHRQQGDADDHVVAGRHHLWHFGGRFGECHGELDGERVAGDRERHAQLQSGGDYRAVGGDDDAVSHLHAFRHDGLHDGNDLGFLTVNKTTPTITWAAPAAITYGTALSTTELNATGSVAGHGGLQSGVWDSARAGASQALQVTFTPADTTDYTTATATVSITVNRVTPTITWATPAAITYGTALSATQLNATGSVAGTMAYNPVAGTVLSAGVSQALQVTLTPTDTTDYTTASDTVYITVNAVASGGLVS